MKDTQLISPAECPALRRPKPHAPLWLTFPEALAVLFSALYSETYPPPLGRFLPADDKNIAEMKSGPQF